MKEGSHKKIIIFLIGILVVIIGIGFVHARLSTGSLRTAKLLSKKTIQKENTDEEIDLQTKNYLQKVRTDTEIVAAELPTPAIKLRAILNETEEKITDYNLKLSEASDIEKKRLAHLLDHEKLSDTVAYVSQMNKTPETLDKIERIVGEIEKNKNANKDIKKILGDVRTWSSKIRQSHSEGDFDGAAREMNNLRQKIIPDLIKNRKLKLDESLKNSLRDLQFSLAIELARPNDLRDEVVDIPPVEIYGTVHVLVCMMKWDTQAPPIDQNELQTIMNQVRAWYEEVSYNAIHISTQYAGGNSVWTGPYPENFPAETAAAIETCDSEVDFSTIDSMIVYPSYFFANGGSAQPVQTQEGNMALGVVMLGGYDDATHTLGMLFNSTVIQHELGHAFGSPYHDDALECGAFPYANSLCESVEYGNIFSVMGYLSKGHFTGWTKHLIGPWGSVGSVTQDGLYTLLPLETSGVEVNTLRIPFGETPLCIEYRKPIGIDEANSSTNFQTQGLVGGIPHNGCIFFNMCPMTGIYAQQRLLIDTTPESNSIMDVSDACLAEGNTFSDSGIGIVASYGPNSDGSATINIDLDENKLVTVPDIALNLLGGSDACTFTTPQRVYILNQTELDITQSFTLRVYGRDAAGNETLLAEHTLSNLDAGESFSLENINASAYQAVRAVVDENNVILESDETNNEGILERNCDV